MRCDDCAPEFGCWNDSQPCRKRPLPRATGSAASYDLYWPCACVKRDRKGRMTALKVNSHNVSRCRVCGAKRDLPNTPNAEGVATPQLHG